MNTKRMIENNRATLFFAGLFLFTLILSMISDGEFSLFILALKIGIIIVFIIVLLRDPLSAVFLFTGTLIVTGVNGSFHQIYARIPLHCVFLALLLGKLFFSEQHRRTLFRNLKEGFLPYFLLAVGIVMPVISSITGFLKDNSALFILSDADAWIFYLFFLCLAGFIHDSRHFRTFIKIIILSSVVSAISLILFSITAKLIPDLKQIIDRLLLEVLHLGGHTESIRGGILRIYTGNGLLYPFALCLCLINIMNVKKKILLKWLTMFLILLAALVISYTRGYWLSSLVSILLLIAFMPMRKKVLFTASSLAMLLVIILGLLPFNINPLETIIYETGQLYKSIFEHSKVKDMLAGTRSGRIYRTKDSGLSWITISDNLESVKISALDRDRENPDKIFCISPDGTLYWTINGGEIWSASSSIQPIDPHSLMWSPFGEGKLILGTQNGLLMEKSCPGETWSLLSSDMEGYDLCILTTDDNTGTMYAATAEGLVFISSNRGNSWSQARKSLNPRIIDISFRAREKLTKAEYIGVLNGKKFYIRNRSTLTKLKQYRALTAFALKNPVFGHGFGATLPGKITFRATNDPNPHVFEAAYAELFMKTGLFGGMLFTALCVAIFISFIKLMRSGNKFTRKYACAFACPFAGTLFAFATNPYINSSFGIMSVVFTSFVLVFLTNHNSSNMQ